MFKHIKDDWKKLRQSEPGHRFQDRYERRHSNGSNWKKFWGPVMIGIGLLVVGFGILLLVIPGPGWVTITLGLALIAGESLILAKILDVLELVIRKLLGKQRMG
ncbi:MAG: hypothetical protein K9N46_09845 [Candidatus Marinimicrobia bacterium]|nr:hypothetical protein [Candidatus Neomarinimicrobiota bacterium]MCF7828381.1 hypothetical protein [Candidatus Neomarinimicrobiota bacterium]MCF7881025.1 hypothetical protein [Candidatus Neomarinimicrobiota bacterium]